MMVSIDQKLETVELGHTRVSYTFDGSTLFVYEIVGCREDVPALLTFAAGLGAQKMWFFCMRKTAVLAYLEAFGTHPEWEPLKVTGFVLESNRWKK